MYWCSDPKLYLSGIIAVPQKSNKQAIILTLDKNNIGGKSYENQ